MIRYNTEEKEKTNSVILFDKTVLPMNYISRTKTVGREYDMVKRYISFLTQKYYSLKNKRAAIFIEPQLDTGYPDIVVVEFSSFPKVGWTDIRRSLNLTDIKVLFYVQSCKKTTIDYMCEVLGFSEDILKQSIKKLKNCKLVHSSKTNKNVSAVFLRSYCRINKIISIEAKIDKWNDAIRQAGNNVWFSTESYILMNKAECSLSIKETCEKLGIGIILVNGTIKTVLKSNKRLFPVSYASLQFNEWILRYLNMEDN